MLWPGTQIEKSQGNAFDWNTGERSIFTQRDIGYAKISQEQTAVVERQRASGKEPMVVHGLSKAADERVRQHKVHAATQAAAKRLKKPGRAIKLEGSLTGGAK